MLKRHLAGATPAVFDDPQPRTGGYGSKFGGASALWADVLAIRQG